MTGNKFSYIGDGQDHSYVTRRMVHLQTIYEAYNQFSLCRIHLCSESFPGIPTRKRTPMLHCDAASGYMNSRISFPSFPSTNPIISVVRSLISRHSTPSLYSTSLPHLLCPTFYTLSRASDTDTMTSPKRLRPKLPSLKNAFEGLDITHSRVNPSPTQNINLGRSIRHMMTRSPLESWHDLSLCQGT